MCSAPLCSDFEVETRVRRALAKKDEAAAALRAEIEARDHKIAGFEESAALHVSCLQLLRVLRIYDCA